MLPLLTIHCSLSALMRDQAFINQPWVWLPCISAQCYMSLWLEMSNFRSQLWNSSVHKPVRSTHTSSATIFLKPFWLAAVAAKSLQSCPTMCDPRDDSPPNSPVPGILQARTPEWVAISFSNAWKWKLKVKSLSHVRLLTTPWTAAHQAPPSMGFSRQEYWSGVPLPSLFKGLGKIIGILMATRMDWRWEGPLIIFWKCPGVPHKTRFQYDSIFTFCQPCQSTWYQSHTNYVKKMK